MIHYRIEGHDVVEEPDYFKWAQWFETSMPARIVGHTQVGAWAISTVFLGLDHNFSRQGPPILFETMAFGPDGADGDEQQRWATYSDAVAGHRRWVEEYRAKQGPDIDVHEIPWENMVRDRET